MLWPQCAAEAARIYSERRPRDFLAVATPGAGKTAFAVWMISMVMGFVQSFTYAEIAGQTVQIETNGVVNNVTFEPGGTARR